MNPELQTVVDRLELLERQVQGWKLRSWVAVMVAVVAIALPFLRGGQAPPTRALFSVVEANRFLLRDRDGRIAGGLEVTPDSTIKLVLGGRYGSTGAAFLQVHGSGAVDLTLRGVDGRVRAALLATSTPSLSLSANGQHSAVSAMAQSDGSGILALTDAEGRTRFRAP